jgi:hypothetical protein
VSSDVATGTRAEEFFELSCSVSKRRPSISWQTLDAFHYHFIISLEPYFLIFTFRAGNGKYFPNFIRTVATFSLYKPVARKKKHNVDGREINQVLM